MTQSVKALNWTSAPKESKDSDGQMSNCMGTYVLNLM